MAELWWESREALAAAFETDAGRGAGRILLEDEAEFIDLPQSPLWLGHEYPQVNPTPETVVARPASPIVKLHFPLRQRPDQSLADAQHYWHTQHGPLIRSRAEAMRILRYQQVHRREDALEGALRDARGTTGDAYAGHAELWLDRSAMSAPTPEGTEAGLLAIEDESRFIDFARSTMFLAKEHVLVDRR